MRLHTLFLAAFAVAALSCNDGGTTVDVVRFDDEPAGATCPAGGLKALSGPDSNGNGVLDDEEVRSARYVCNGRSGETGGINGLITVSAEPPGDNCPNGGSRIEVGTDSDGDGVLGEGEVTGTRFICDSAPPDDVWYGDFVAMTADDMTLLDGIHHITGDLRIEQYDATALTLPGLVTIGGALVTPRGYSEGEGDVEPQALERVDLPALERCGDVTVMHSYGLRELRLPKLARATAIDIESSSDLTLLDLPSLARVVDFSLSNNAAVETLTLPVLERASTISMSYNDALTTLSAPSLRHAGSITIYGSPSLSHCQALSLVANVHGLNGQYSLWGLDESPTCAASEVCRTMVAAGLTGTWSVCAQPLAWADAEAMCATRGAGHHLAWLSSQAEWDALLQTLGDSPISEAWLGYSQTGASWTAASGFTAFDAPTSVTGFWFDGSAPNTPGSGAYLLGELSTCATAALDSELAFYCKGP